MKDVLLILAGALAGGLGWGLRGQVGHEIGAMAPGALVAAVLVAAAHRAGFGPEVLLLVGVFAAALSIGGNMTYGQTLGLCHGPPELRRYWWGLLGCGIKGAVWWGLGMLLAVAMTSRLPSKARAAVVLASLVGGLVGYLLLNRPFAPPKALPRVYFSGPLGAPGKPRHETWGALAGAMLCGLLAYVFAIGAAGPEVRQPLLRAALLLIGAGVLGGGLGFSLGEAAQAWGALKVPFGARVQQWLDWWKVMEVTFGLIAGAVVTVGWLLALRLFHSTGAGPGLPLGADPWHWLPAGIGDRTASLAVAVAVGLPYVLWQVHWAPAERLVDVPLV
ncbi:MAG: hypothetical protein J7M26_05860, partial [Armatimonadetes bacterium]|nr:hypothetical protein [Armatimonadota bacterium]